MSTAGGTISEWYRFLDARTDDDAACEVTRHAGRLEQVYADLAYAAKALSYTPGGDVDSSLRVSLTTLGEAIEMLDDVLRRIRAGERHAAV